MNIQIRMEQRRKKERKKERQTEGRGLGKRNPRFSIQHSGGTLVFSTPLAYALHPMHARCTYPAGPATTPSMMPDEIPLM